MQNNYDAIIIGAGVSGLVCGCYLAKAGMKVLIVEKNANVGGCCTSFKAKGFLFDAFAHSVGGLNEGGILDIVLKDLKIKKRFNFERHDPSDIIITPEYKINFWSDLDRSADELKTFFPGESANIERLLKFLALSKGEASTRLMNVTFLTLLNEFIKNDKLKAILSMPVFGNIGLPPSLISAFTAAKLYQNFLIDGGYYPVGGMQSLPDLLVETFKEHGGVIKLSNEVKKILLTESGMACGIEIKRGEKIFSKVVVSNCDATKTFFDLIGDADLIRKPRFKNMQPSVSIFSVLVGTNKIVTRLSRELRASAWYMFDYDIESIYSQVIEGKFKDFRWFLVHASPDEKGFVASILAPFKDEKFWHDNKDSICKKLISSVEEELPVLKEAKIEYKTTITPQTIFKWTGNFHGAAYGWASTPAQLAASGFTQNTPIIGLFLTGHWTTLSSGVSGVAYIGRQTAKIILGRKRDV